MTDISNITTQRAIQGLTLVEVMIALVILSVGLLGLAGLQIQGLRGTSGSNSRVQATLIISDMAARMHANAEEVARNLTYANVTIDASACGGAPTNCNTSECNTGALAAHDNFEICTTMANSLPFGATLNIRCDAAPCVAGIDNQSASTHTLTLNWNEVQDGSLGGGTRAQSVALQIQPILPEL